VPEQLARPAAKAPNYGTNVFTQYEYRHAFWQVPEPVSSAMDFYRHHAHTPAGFASGFVGYGLTNPYQGTVFDGRFVGGRVENRILVSFVPSHGATIIRLDAGVPWTVPRSPSEALPDAVREVDIRSYVPSHRWTRRVTDPRELALIRRWFNDLNVVQPNTMVWCAADGMSAWPVQFTFRAANGGKLASALVPPYAASSCGEIQFTSHGERQPPLIDSTPFNGKAFVYRVEGLLGLSLGPRFHH